jgi:hypothetical protein
LEGGEKIAMKSIQLESEVGADGVLELRIPLGIDDARSRVVVTIQSLPSSEPQCTCNLVDWHDFVQRTYGSCAGLGLEEPPDLPLQQDDWSE